MVCTSKNSSYRAIIVISSNDYNHFPGMMYLPLLSIPFIFVCIMKGQHNSIKIQSFIMMIKKYTGLYRYFHLKSAGRPKRMGHNTCKSMGSVLCVVRRNSNINNWLPG